MMPTGLRLATASVLAGALLSGCGSSADDSADNPAEDPSASSSSAPVSASDVEPVADWLAGEVSEKGFVTGPYVDHGLSLDFAATLAAVGGHDEVVTALLDAMQDPKEIEGYLSFYDEQKNGQYAGATAKLVTVVVDADREIADYRDDLVDDLQAMVVAEGAEAGRAKDTGPTDYSNAISQSYVVRALAVSGADEPLAATVEFLLAQQCEGGGFRESLAAGPGGEHSCEAAAEADATPSVDATAHAVQALLEVGEELEGELQTTAATAVDDAVEWLEDSQGTDGGHSVSGTPAEAPNANSTGLAVTALAEAGSDAAADGAMWLLDHRVPTEGALAEEAGAITFSDATLAKARKGGIKPADRPQWQRATVEAAAGLHAVAGG